MPRVTIGVPVYNSENLLEQCLENLAAQTFQDFKVIILDNASTDGTAAIAQRFAARDSRFTYRRQPHNVGAQANFADVLAMADTPYFMWRADDDLASVNFMSETVRLLDERPSAALAVARVELEKKGRRRVKSFPQRWAVEPAAIYRVRLLLRSRSSWIYGMFRTDELKASLAHVFSNFPHVNAFDHLAMYPFLLTLRVVGSNDAAFETGFVERPNGGRNRGFIDPVVMATLRRDFFQYCTAELPQYVPNPLTAALMRPVISFYAERSYRWTKLAAARVRVLMGQTPKGAPKNYG